MRQFLARSILLSYAAVASVQTARAAEYGLLAFPPGATSVFAVGLPEIAGVFSLNQFDYTSSSGLYDSKGNKLPISFHVTTYSDTARFISSYGQLFGVNVYQQLLAPFVSAKQSTYAQNNAASGFANITVSPVIMQWTLPAHQRATVALDIATPLSSYDPKKFSVGQDYMSFQPVVGYRYDNPGGLDIGFMSRFLINTENTNVRYHSGSALIADYVAGWHFSTFELGITGAYSDQFVGDILRGVRIGNKFREFKIGPTLAFNAGPVVVNVNYQSDVYIANGSKSNSLWFNVAVPLWVPG